MKNKSKTKEQLIAELTQLRVQNTSLAKSIAGNISLELAVEEACRYAESIVETVREPLLVMDADLKILSANHNFYRTFKVTPGETLGSFIYDLGNKQWDIPKLRELLEDILPEKESFDDFEVDHNFQDIGHKIMLLNARRIYRKDTGVQLILLAIEDITEHKLAESAIRDCELRFKELFENMSSCMAVYEASAEGTDFIFKDFNRAAEIAEKIDRKKLIGKSVLQVFPGVRAMGLLEVLQRVWKTGQPEHYPANYYKDKRIAGWRENYVYKLPTGEVVTLYNDITERKKAETLIFESEEKYRMLVENSSEAIFIAQDAMLKFANRASLTLFGLSSEVLTSIPFVEFIHPEDREMVLGSHLRRLKGEKIPPVYTFRIVTGKGIVKWVEIHASIVPWQGKPATLNFLTDITEHKQAEELLKQSEARYHSLFDSAHDAIVLMDRDTIIDCNERAAELFRCPKEKIIGDTTTNFWPERQADGRLTSEVSLERIKKALRNERGSNEVRHLRADGTLVDTDVTLNIFEMNGKKYLQAIIRDITERKKAEEALALNFETQAAMNVLLGLSLEARPVKEYLECALDLVLSLQWLAIEAKGAIFLTDKAGETLHLLLHKGFSKELCAICKTVPFGHCLCGRAAASRAVQFANRVDERHDTRYEGMPQHGHYCVPILSGDHILGVIVLYVKEGHIRSPWEEDFLTAVANSLAGTIERRRAEEELQESEEKYRSILENMEESYFEVDIAGNLTFFNDSLCRQLGYSRDELMGMNNRQYTDKEYANRQYQVFNTIYRTGISSQSSDWKIIRKDGTHRYCEASVSLMKNTSGQPAGFCGLSRDITERNQTEESLLKTLKELQESKDMLVQSEKLAAVGRLSAGVAHEILNPVNIISMRLQLLEETEGISDTLEETLLVCQKQIDRIVKITKDISQFSRVSAKDLETGDLNSIIEQTFHLIVPRLKMEKITLEIHAHPDLPFVAVDRNRLEQVLLNLINNAIDSMEDMDKKELYIRTELAASDDGRQWARITVSDRGKGISEDKINKIFDPFFTTKEKGKGTGLGLFICYGIIQDHRGTITAKNNENGGASFIIDLPLSLNKLNSGVSE